jgi:hypothetical protein
VLAWLVPAGPAQALTVGEAVNRYAPLVRLYSTDTDRPMSTARFINKSSLKFAHDEGCDDSLVADTGTVKSHKLGNGGYSWHTNHRVVDFPNPIKCEDEGDPYTTADYTRPRDSNNETGAEGFYLNLDNDFRGGTGTDARVYFEYHNDPRSITYWFLYGNNVGPGSGGFDDHEGDWERISIQLDNNNHPIEVVYFQHNGSCALPWNDAPKTPAGRPRVFSATGSHASYPRKGDYTFTVNVHGIPVDVTDHANAGPRWRTWKNLAKVQGQRWYGYGGGWGEVGDLDSSTGPLGPSPYKLGFPNDGFNLQPRCEMPDRTGTQ